MRWYWVLPPVLCVSLLVGQGSLQAAKVTVELHGARGVTLVAVLNRWDRDGNPRRPVDPKAKIDAPRVDADAVPSRRHLPSPSRPLEGQVDVPPSRREGTAVSSRMASRPAGRSTWIFENLPPGRYDLLIIARDPTTKKPVRIEGWHYPPVLEFNPPFPPSATTDDDTRRAITEQIANSRHYENKVVPLYMGGDEKAVRVLVMLIRDKPTSYKRGVGTIRHEVWQYSFKYGGWQKEKRTKVLDRIALPVGQLRRWTWLWDPQLGGIEVGRSPVTIHYELPKQADQSNLKGLYPY